LIVPVSLALFGGLAGYILKEKENRSFKEFCADMVIAAFAGVIMFFILENYENLSGHWKAVFIAMTGCMAREVLIIIQRKFMYTVEAAGRNPAKRERGDDDHGH